MIEAVAAVQAEVFGFKPAPYPEQAQLPLMVAQRGQVVIIVVAEAQAEELLFIIRQIHLI